MTRINAFINPASLCDKHLLAEHREIIRIPNQIKAGKLSLNNQPPSFKLGTGHVKFFGDKLFYLHKRYQSLYVECKRRGFNVTDFSSVFNNIPSEFYNDFRPSGLETQKIVNELSARILERMPKNPKFTSYKY